MHHFRMLLRVSVGMLPSGLFRLEEYLDYAPGYRDLFFAAKPFCSIIGFSLFGAMFPLPRIIYAMANDGLIFRFLGKISRRFRTPLFGTILSGVLTGNKKKAPCFNMIFSMTLS